MTTRFLSLTVVLALTASFALLPYSTSNAATQWHGFVTQGFSQTSANQVYGDSQGSGSWDFREIGVNGSHRQADDLFSGQVLSREAGPMNDSSIKVDFLLWDHRLYQVDGDLSGIRIGRVKNPLGFYNATRDVASTRPSIMLPQSIYFDRTRDLALSSDGVNFYLERSLVTGNLNLEVQVARPRIDSSKLEAILLRRDLPMDFQAKTSYIMKLSYDPAGSGLNLAYSAAKVNADFDQGSLHFVPQVFSLQYNTHNWSITSEYARRKLRFKDLESYQLVDSITGESAYLAMTYRFNDTVTAILRYDRTYQNRNDKEGDAAARLGLPARTQFAKDWTLGAGWTPSPPWLLRVEHHWIDGGAWLAPADNPNLFNPGFDSTQRYWRLLLFQVSYQF